MSGYYLLDNPSRIPQHRTVRRNGAAPSGVVVLHTAENATDFEGVDSGAEAVARFIATRTDPGSYHVLVDSDSTIRLAPWSAESWHDTRTNNHSVGISAAVRSADWTRLGARGDRAVVRMALAAREYATWLHKTRGITIPARRITRAQAVAQVPGFIGHGEIDTGRRTDPGRDFNWPLFLAVYARPSLAASHGITITPEDDMPPFRDWPQADKDALAQHVWAYKTTHDTRDAWAILRAAETGVRGLPRAVAAAVWSFKRTADKVRGADRIDVVQMLADVLTKVTGKAPDTIKHPAQRTSPTDF